MLQKRGVSMSEMKGKNQVSRDGVKCVQKSGWGHICLGITVK